MNQRINNGSFLKTLDYQVLLIYLFLVFWGWLSIYSASYDYESSRLLDLAQFSGKQFLWIGISLVVGVLLLVIDSRWYYNTAEIIYILVMALLMATIVLATDVKGSRSWLVFGPVSLQPAEFAKFATGLALAKYIDKHGFRPKESKRDYLTYLIIFLPVLLILLQQETGSALVYFSLFFVLYREGMSPKLLLAGCCAAAYFVVSIRYGNMQLWDATELGTFLVLLLILAITLFMFYLNNPREKQSLWLLLGTNLLPLLLAVLCNVVGWHFNLCWPLLVTMALSLGYLGWLVFKKNVHEVGQTILFAVLSVAFLFAVGFIFDHVLKPHQQVRTQVFLGVVDDPTNAGYNVNQAKISIGSGGLAGKGFLNGTQTKLKYVPEQHTDFIFCTIGEEWGFIGSVLLLLVYLYLMIRLILMAERQRSRFVRVYGYCVVCIFFFHVLINVGMVLGIMPVIGIPLPFFSYGGSSLLGFTILLFIFLKLDAERLRYH